VCARACAGKAMLDDFADEVADIVGMSSAAGTGGKGSRLADLFNRQKVSQKFGADAPRAEARGGDEDVPRRWAKPRPLNTQP
jgi:U3 small nucleolar RNA-associated protein 3